MVIECRVPNPLHSQATRKTQEKIQGKRERKRKYSTQPRRQRKLLETNLPNFQPDFQTNLPTNITCKFRSEYFNLLFLNCMLFFSGISRKRYLHTSHKNDCYSQTLSPKYIKLVVPLDTIYGYIIITTSARNYSVRLYIKS